MGDLDDAIREHLELKRKHGASEEEVTLKEREAQKQGALPSDGGAIPAEEAPEPPAADIAEPEPELETGEAAASTTAEPPTPMLDELDPDEVLPEEALELDVPPAHEPEETAGPAPDWSTGDPPPEDTEDPGEDVLEDTPEFLEETAEQDRLWFEQRPPKDFDFDD